MSLLFLDVATVPDFKLGERLYNLHDLSEKDIARVMSTKSREKTNESDSSSRHLLQIVAVSILVQNEDGISLHSTAGLAADEHSHLEFLSDVFNQKNPEIITWDREETLAVLNFRYLSNAIKIPLTGDSSVVDLMSELSVSELSSPVPLHEIAVLSGSPVINELSKEAILDAYLQGNHDLIRTNLELNVINTWLIYLRWQIVKGIIDQAAFDAEKKLLKKVLLQEDRIHLTAFVDALK